MAPGLCGLRLALVLLALRLSAAQSVPNITGFSQVTPLTTNGTILVSSYTPQPAATFGCFRLAYFDAGISCAAGDLVPDFVVCTNASLYWPMTFGGVPRGVFRFCMAPNDSSTEWTSVGDLEVVVVSRRDMSAPSLTNTTFFRTVSRTLSAGIGSSFDWNYATLPPVRGDFFYIIQGTDCFSVFDPFLYIFNGSSFPSATISSFPGPMSICFVLTHDRESGGWSAAQGTPLTLMLDVTNITQAVANNRAQRFITGNSSSNATISVTGSPRGGWEEGDRLIFSRNGCVANTASVGSTHSYAIGSGVFNNSLAGVNSVRFVVATFYNVCIAGSGTSGTTPVVLPFQIDVFVPPITKLADSASYNESVPFSHNINNGATTVFQANDVIQLYRLPDGPCDASLAITFSGSSWTPSTFTVGTPGTYGVCFWAVSSDLRKRVGDTAQVVINDTTPPVGTVISYAAVNARSVFNARNGTLVYLNFSANEPLSSVNVSLGGVAATVRSAAANSSVFSAELVVPESLPDGQLGFVIAYADVPGNRAADLVGTTATDGGNVVIDNVAPVLTARLLESNSSVNASFARAGDTVQLTFNASEALSERSVTLLGAAATSITSLGGTLWLATSVQVTSGTPNGLVSFSVTAFDLAGNTASISGSSATSDAGAASQVTIDTLFQVSVTMASNSSVDTERARVGDTVTVTVTSLEPLLFSQGSLPVIVIGGFGVTAIDAGSLVWTGSATINSSFAEGPLSLSVSGFTDRAGNGDSFTAVTSGQGVTVDRTAPTIIEFRVATNRTGPARVVNGSAIVLGPRDLLTVQLIVSEPVLGASAGSRAVSVTVGGVACNGSLTRGPDATNWTVTCVAGVGGRSDGLQTVAISVFDLAGNPLASPFSAQQDASGRQVFYDGTPPSVLDLTLTNATFPVRLRAKVGDRVTLTYSSDSPINADHVVEFGPRSVIVAPTALSETSFLANYTVAAEDPQGQLRVVIRDFRDDVDNVGTTVSTFTANPMAIGSLTVERLNPQAPQQPPVVAVNTLFSLVDITFAAGSPTPLINDEIAIVRATDTTCSSPLALAIFTGSSWEQSQVTAGNLRVAERGPMRLCMRGFEETGARRLANESAGLWVTGSVAVQTLGGVSGGHLSAFAGVALAFAPTVVADSNFALGDRISLHNASESCSAASTVVVSRFNGAAWVQEDAALSAGQLLVSRRGNLSACLQPFNSPGIFVAVSPPLWAAFRAAPISHVNADGKDHVLRNTTAALSVGAVLPVQGDRLRLFDHAVGSASQCSVTCGLDFEFDGTAWRQINDECSAFNGAPNTLFVARTGHFGVCYRPISGPNAGAYVAESPSANLYSLAVAGANSFLSCSGFRMRSGRASRAFTAGCDNCTRVSCRLSLRERAGIDDNALVSAIGSPFVTLSSGSNYTAGALGPLPAALGLNFTTYYDFSFVPPTASQAGSAPSMTVTVVVNGSALVTAVVEFAQTYALLGNYYSPQQALVPLTVASQCTAPLQSTLFEVPLNVNDPGVSVSVGVGYAFRALLDAQEGVGRVPPNDNATFSFATQLPGDGVFFLFINVSGGTGGMQLPPYCDRVRPAVVSVVVTDTDTRRAGVVRPGNRVNATLSASEALMVTPVVRLGSASTNASVSGGPVNFVVISTVQQSGGTVPLSLFVSNLVDLVGNTGSEVTSGTGLPIVSPLPNILSLTSNSGSALTRMRRGVARALSVSLASGTSAISGDSVALVPVSVATCDAPVAADLVFNDTSATWLHVGGLGGDNSLNLNFTGEYQLGVRPFSVAGTTTRVCNGPDASARVSVRGPLILSLVTSNSTLVQSAVGASIALNVSTLNGLPFVDGDRFALRRSNATGGCTGANVLPGTVMLFTAQGFRQDVDGNGAISAGDGAANQLTLTVQGLLVVCVGYADSQGATRWADQEDDAGAPYELFVASNESLALSELGNLSVTVALPVSISIAVSGGVQPLSITASSSNASVVTNASLTATTSRLDFTPQAAGITTITLRVSDATNVVITRSFVLTVNVAPALSVVSSSPPFTTRVGSAHSGIALTVVGGTMPFQFSAQSSNTSVVPSGAIGLENSGGTSRSPTLRPLPSVQGRSNLTVLLTDASSATSSASAELIAVGLPANLSLLTCPSVARFGEALVCSIIARDGSNASVMALASDFQESRTEPSGLQLTVTGAPGSAIFSLSVVAPNAPTSSLSIEGRAFSAPFAGGPVAVSVVGRPTVQSRLSCSGQPANASFVRRGAVSVCVIQPRNAANEPTTAAAGDFVSPSVSPASISVSPVQGATGASSFNFSWTAPDNETLITFGGLLSPSLVAGAQPTFTVQVVGTPTQRSSLSCAGSVSGSQRVRFGEAVHCTVTTRGADGSVTRALLADLRSEPSVNVSARATPLQGVDGGSVFSFSVEAPDGVAALSIGAALANGTALETSVEVEAIGTAATPSLLVCEGPQGDASATPGDLVRCTLLARDAANQPVRILREDLVQGGDGRPALVASVASVVATASSVNGTDNTPAGAFSFTLQAPPLDHASRDTLVVSLNLSVRATPLSAPVVPVQGRFVVVGTPVAANSSLSCGSVTGRFLRHGGGVACTLLPGDAIGAVAARHSDFTISTEPPGLAVTPFDLSPAGPYGKSLAFRVTAPTAGTVVRVVASLRVNSTQATVTSLPLAVAGLPSALSNFTCESPAVLASNQSVAGLCQLLPVNAAGQRVTALPSDFAFSVVSNTGANGVATISGADNSFSFAIDVRVPLRGTNFSVSGALIGLDAAPQGGTVALLQAPRVVVVRPGSAPSPPLSVRAGNLSYVRVVVNHSLSAATITWQPPASDGGRPVTVYRVTYRAGGSAAPRVVFVDDPKTEVRLLDLPSDVDRGPGSLSNVTVTVSAGNEVGFGPESVAVSFVPLPQPPLPVQLTATPGGSTPGFSADDQVAILFDQPTNTPPATTAADVNALLEFSSPFGTNYVGNWASPSLLVLTVVDPAIPGGSSVAAPAVGTFRVTVRNSSALLNARNTSLPWRATSPPLGGSFGFSAGALLNSEKQQVSTDEDRSIFLREFGINVNAQGRPGSLSIEVTALSSAGSVGVSSSATEPVLTGTRSSSARLSGSLSQLQGFITTLVFEPTTNFNGLAALRVTLSENDLDLDSLIVFVQVLPVNDPPRIATASGLGSVFNVAFDGATPFLNNFTVEDVDSQTASALLVVSVDQGALRLLSVASSDLIISPQLTSSQRFSIQGPVSALNQQLQRLAFVDSFEGADMVGDATLAFAVDDLANGGTPALTAVASFTLRQQCKSDTPPGVLSGCAFVDAASLLCTLSASAVLVPARSGLPPCSALFSNETTILLGGGPRCELRGREIRVTLGADPAVAVGSVVLVARDALVRCAVSTVFIAAQTISVGAPSVAPPPPRVQLYAPARVSCANVTITWQVTGVGLRAFTAQWSASNAGFQAPVATPSAGMIIAQVPANGSLTVTLRVVNFLQAASSATVTVERVGSDSAPVPTIDLPSPLVVRVTRPLSLSGRAALPCGDEAAGGTQPPRTLLSWSFLPAVAAGSGVDLAQPRLNLPANALLPSATYTVTLTAALASNPRINSSRSITLTTEPRPVYVSIRGGVRRTLRQGTMLVLDASTLCATNTPATEDEPCYRDPQDAFYRALVPSWSCFTDTGVPCTDAVTREVLRMPAQLVVNVSGSSLPLGKATFRVTVNGVASAEQTVVVTPFPAAPSVAIVTAPAAVGSGDTLVIVAQAVASASSGSAPLLLRWTEVSEAQLSLAEPAASGQGTVRLVVNPSALPNFFTPGARYVFRFTARPEGIEQASSVDHQVTVLPAPQGGSLLVTPSSDLQALATPVQLSVQRVEATDSGSAGLLQFEFFFVDPATQREQPLASAPSSQPLLSLASGLPQGDPANGFRLTVVAYVWRVGGALRARSRLTAVVVVSPAATATLLSSGELLRQLRSAVTVSDAAQSADSFFAAAAPALAALAELPLAERTGVAATQLRAAILDVAFELRELFSAAPLLSLVGQSLAGPELRCGSVTQRVVTILRDVAEERIDAARERTPSNLRAVTDAVFGAASAFVSAVDAQGEGPCPSGALAEPQSLNSGWWHVFSLQPALQALQPSDADGFRAVLDAQMAAVSRDLLSVSGDVYSFSANQSSADAGLTVLVRRGPSASPLTVSLASGAVRVSVPADFGRSLLPNGSLDLHLAVMSDAPARLTLRLGAATASGASLASHVALVDLFDVVRGASLLRGPSPAVSVALRADADSSASSLFCALYNTSTHEWQAAAVPVQRDVDGMVACNASGAAMVALFQVTEPASDSSLLDLAVDNWFYLSVGGGALVVLVCVTCVIVRRRKARQRDRAKHLSSFSLASIVADQNGAEHAAEPGLPVRSQSAQHLLRGDSEEEEKKENSDNAADDAAERRRLRAMLRQGDEEEVLEPAAGAAAAAAAGVAPNGVRLQDAGGVHEEKRPEEDGQLLSRSQSASSRAEPASSKTPGRTPGGTRRETPGSKRTPAGPHGPASAAGPARGGVENEAQAAREEELAQTVAEAARTQAERIGRAGAGVGEGEADPAGFHEEGQPQRPPPLQNVWGDEQEAVPQEQDGEYTQEVAGGTSAAEQEQDEEEYSEAGASGATESPMAGAGGPAGPQSSPSRKQLLGRLPSSSPKAGESASAAGPTTRKRATKNLPPLEVQRQGTSALQQQQQQQRQLQPAGPPLPKEEKKDDKDKAQKK